MLHSALAVALFGVVVLTGVLEHTSTASLQQPHARPLKSIVAGGKGPPVVVLLHGFCSSAEAWRPIAQSLHLSPGSRFVFPEGPDVGTHTGGVRGGRAWWPLELDLFVPAGQTLPDLSGERPRGLGHAAARVGELVDALRHATRGPVVLGGFSQGAMVAAEVAFTSSRPLAALVLLSATPVDEDTWKANLELRKGLRVFLSHGRSDDVLSFALAERLRDEMVAAGLAVTWVPFDGGHEMSPVELLALETFLRSLPPPSDLTI